MRIKRVLSILLTVCFLMSVTAAAVSACDDSGDTPIDEPGDTPVVDPGDTPEENSKKETPLFESIREKFLENHPSKKKWNIPPGLVPSTGVRG